MVKLSFTKKALTRTFDAARQSGVDYVFVAIRAEGVDEVIVIPKRSFDEKEKFYMNAYNDDLKHVMNKEVYIRGLSYGSCNELENVI